MENQAVYGSNTTASYAQNLLFDSVDNNDPMVRDSARRRASLNFTNFEVVSGTPLSFNINITDANGQLYSAENSATAAFLHFGYMAENDVSLLGSEAVANGGVFNFTGFTIITQPNSTIEIELVVNIRTETSTVDFTTENFMIEVYVRPCRPGEAFTPEGKCEVCPSGTYLLEAPREVKACEACESNSRCFGQNLIAPMAAYWRPDEDKSSEFISCLNKQACLAGDEFNLMGVCSTGYQGPLCS